MPQLSRAGDAKKNVENQMPISAKDKAFCIIIFPAKDKYKGRALAH